MWCWQPPYRRKELQKVKKKCIKIHQEFFKRGQIHSYRSKNKTRYPPKNFITDTDLQDLAKGSEVLVQGQVSTNSYKGGWPSTAISLQEDSFT